MRRARTGYATIIGPHRTQEFDTFTCGHCQNMRHVKPFCDPADLGGLCKVCMRVICEQCVKTNMCDPFEEKLKRAEARHHARRWMEGG